MNLASRLFVSLVFIAVALFSGCRHDHVRTEPVTGIVTLDGQPVEGAIVTFLLTDPPPKEKVADVSTLSAVGETDGKGRYALTMHPKGAIRRGTVPGRYDVTIRKTETIFEGASNEDSGEGLSMKIVEIVPKRYSKASTSELKAEVVKGNNVFDFSLKK